MGRKKLILLVVVMAIVIGGCGKISDERITISGYKGLKVEKKAEDFESDVWKALLESCTVDKYPEEELNGLIEELEQQYSYVAYYEGQTASELIEERHGMTTEELAKEQLKKEYAIELIAETEDLTLSSKEYEEQLAKEAEANGLSNAEEYESMFGQEELMKMFLEERVLSFLVENLK